MWSVVPLQDNSKQVLDHLILELLKDKEVHCIKTEKLILSFSIKVEMQYNVRVSFGLRKFGGMAKMCKRELKLKAYSTGLKKKEWARFLVVSCRKVYSRSESANGFILLCINLF